MPAGSETGNGKPPCMIGIALVGMRIQRQKSYSASRTGIGTSVLAVKVSFMPQRSVFFLVDSGMRM